MTTPPQLHWQREESSSAATPRISTPEAPGVHGVSTGTHGCGAPFALATAGFAVEVQSPSGGTFDGDTSVTTPAGAVADTAVPDAENVAGTLPSEQLTEAPVQTWVGIG